MTDAQEREKKAALLLEYQEAKQSLVLLENDADKMADTLEKGAELLRRQPEGIDAVEHPYFPSYAQIFELATKIKKLKIDITDKQSALRKLGLTDL